MKSIELTYELGIEITEIARKLAEQYDPGDEPDYIVDNDSAKLADLHQFLFVVFSGVSRDMKNQSGLVGIALRTAYMIGYRAGQNG